MNTNIKRDFINIGQMCTHGDRENKRIISFIPAMGVTLDGIINDGKSIKVRLLMSSGTWVNGRRL